MITFYRMNHFRQRQKNYFIYCLFIFLLILCPKNLKAAHRNSSQQNNQKNKQTVVSGILIKNKTEVGDWMLFTMNNIYALKGRINSYSISGDPMTLSGIEISSKRHKEQNSLNDEKFLNPDIFEIQKITYTSYPPELPRITSVSGKLIQMNNTWILDAGQDIYILKGKINEYREGADLMVWGIPGSYSKLNEQLFLKKNCINNIRQKVQSFYFFTIDKKEGPTPYGWEKLNTKILHYNRYGIVDKSVNVSEQVYTEVNSLGNFWTLSAEPDSNQKLDANAMFFMFYDQDGNKIIEDSCQKYTPNLAQGNWILLFKNNGTYQIYDKNNPEDIFCTGSFK